MKEAAEQNWSTRALDRQIKSLYYERMLMSRDKAPLIEEMREQTAPLAANPKDFIKAPYVLEFLGLQDNPGFREAELETAINLQTAGIYAGAGQGLRLRRPPAADQHREQGFLCRSGFLQLHPQVFRACRFEVRRVDPPGHRADSPREMPI